MTLQATATLTIPLGPKKTAIEKYSKESLEAILFAQKNLGPHFSPPVSFEQEGWHTQALYRLWRTEYNNCNEPSESSKPEPILLASCVVGAVTWEIKTLVRHAQPEEPDPAAAHLTGYLFHLLHTLMCCTGSTQPTLLAICGLQGRFPC